MSAPIKILLITIVFILHYSVFAKDFIYILNDACINNLYNSAKVYFDSTSVIVIKDPQGIILRFKLNAPLANYKELTPEACKEIRYVEHFLAKIENPAIIEVHMAESSDKESVILKNWEVSTVIANNIESKITTPVGALKRNRIHSVGYGEFLPAKNTPYNGGNYLNRVDIIILCNISGE